MSITFADIQADVATARTAIGSRDWESAEVALLQAAAGLAAIPDSKLGESEHRFRADIDALLTHVRRMKTAASVALKGIQTTAITPT